MDVQTAINQQTKSKLFVSLASKPGSTGKKFYTALFEYYKIDAEYVACSCIDLAADMELVREHCDGASITMPFKQQVVNYIDHTVNSNIINTVVNNSGTLIGYNCDYYGLEDTIAPLLSTKNVVILGNGAMAENVVSIAALNNAKTIVVNRENWELRHLLADVVVNTTPIGMSADESPLDSVEHVSTVIDCVIGSTKLIELARAANKNYITGADIYVSQFKHQFKLYTGIDPHANVVASVAKEVFNV